MSWIHKKTISPQYAFSLRSQSLHLHFCNLHLCSLTAPGEGNCGLKFPPTTLSLRSFLCLVSDALLQACCEERSVFKLTHSAPDCYPTERLITVYCANICIEMASCKSYEFCRVLFRSFTHLVQFQFFYCSDQICHLYNLCYLCGIRNRICYRNMNASTR